MKRTLQYRSALGLLLIVLAFDGCASPEPVRPVNFSNLPAVTGIAENLSPEKAIAELQTAITAGKPQSDDNVTVNGLQTKQQVTRPAEYVPDVFDDDRTPTINSPNWQSPAMESRRIISQQQITVPVFLPFAEIDRVSVETVSQTPQIIHRVTIFAGKEKQTSILIDDTHLNTALAALYTLCPKLRQ